MTDTTTINPEDTMTSTTTEQTEQTEPEGTATDEQTPSSEAAKYRTKLRSAEAERDALTGQLDVLRRAEAERLAETAARALHRGDDLWTAGTEVADLLGEDGRVDPERVAEAVASVAEQRPHLLVSRSPRPDLSQGAHGDERNANTWAGLLQG